MTFQTGLVSWSKTAATNGNADSNVNMAEGMAPSAVNDGVRAAMASVAKYRDDNAGTLTTGGTSTAYTLTTNQVFSSLTVLNGQKLKVRFNATNGASPTLAVDSLTAAALQIDATNAVPTGGILADSIWDVTYDNSIPAFIVNGYPQTLGDASVAGTLDVTGDATFQNVTVDGTFTFTLPGKSLQYGDIINGTIVESNATNAVTFSLKTLAGNDPSSSDPVLICFRNSTNTDGDYVVRTISAATTLTISSGSKVGASDGVAFKLHLVLFDDAGAVRIGAINLESGTSIYALSQSPMIASSTAEGGAGAADSAQVFYTGTAVTSKPYLPFAIANYDSGLTTAGSWNVDPKLQLIGPGQMIPRALNAKEIPYGPKAWAEGTTSGGVLTQNTGYNCTVTRQSQGNFTCTFTNAMTDANYAFVGTVDNASDGIVFMRKTGGTKTTTAFQFIAESLVDSAGFRDPAWWCVVVFGN